MSTDGKLRLQNVASSIFVIPNEFETAASRRLMKPTVPVIGGDGVLFGLIMKSFYGLWFFYWIGEIKTATDVV